MPAIENVPKREALARHSGPGFFGGALAIFRGIGFIVARPRTWPLAIMPTFIATVLLLLCVVGGYWGGFELVRELYDRSAGTLGAAAAIACGALFVLLVPIVAFLVAASLAQPLSCLALDALAHAQAVEMGLAPGPSAPFHRAALRSLKVSLVGLAFSVPLLALLWTITMFFPPASVVTFPLKLLVCALAVAWDFLDYPLSLRGMSVRERLAWMGAHFWAVLGFGLASATVLLIPFVGLFLLPIGVAGGTRLVAVAERAGSGRD